MKKAVQGWLGLIAAVALGGCMKVPVLSPSAEGVRVVVKAEPDAACKELGDVTTGNDWYKDESAVKIALRNQVAEKGGNLLALDVLKFPNGNLAGGSGRAFRCP
jgi:hypothetical protein